MGLESKIEWTDATWNPWHGCKKVSPGCKYCYMFRDKERFKKEPTEVVRSSSNFNSPMKWKEGRRIFTCSWSDFFIEEADAWRDEAWEVIRQTPQHTYQILTKRPERIHENLPRYFEALDNVWIGVSVENQEQAYRLMHLADLHCKTFVSFEPLLGPIEWDWFMVQLDWVILGGESGNEIGAYQYRNSKAEWFEPLIDKGSYFGIPVFVKQLGTGLAKELGLKSRHGKVMDEWPNPFLRVRQNHDHFENIECEQNSD